MSNGDNASAADLLVFARVLEAGSFSAAAERLGLPKSSVSRRIAALEQRLGERLLTRSTRRLTATDFGRALAGHAQRLAEEVDAVRALAEHRRSEPSGLLRVSMPGDLATFVLPRMLVEFGGRHPALEIQLDLSPRRVDLVAENFDLAIRMGELPDDATLAARRVHDFETGLVAAPSYLARHGSPRRPEDLPGHHCVPLLARDGRSAPWQLERGGQRWRQVMTGRLSANSMGALVHLALAGAGIAAVSLRYAELLIRDGRLERVLADWRTPSVAAWAVMPSRRLIPPKTRLFVAALQQALQQDGEA